MLLLEGAVDEVACVHEWDAHAGDRLVGTHHLIAVPNCLEFLAGPPQAINEPACNRKDLLQGSFPPKELPVLCGWLEILLDQVNFPAKCLKNVSLGAVQHGVGKGLHATFPLKQKPIKD